MRVFALCAMLLLACVAFAQTPVYGPVYGPYVPLVTTPQISLQTVSPNAVGARNATYGLVAGARNATSDVVNNGNTSSSFTEPVWYQGGGAPLISEPEVSLHVRDVRGGHMMHMPMMMMGEHEHMAEHATAGAWTYLAGEELPSAVEAAGAAKNARKATRTITNQDVDAENQKTGTVKYDGKTEKIQ
jgi:hypothetical protein